MSLTIRSRKGQSRFSKPPHVCYGFGENLSRHLVHILLLPCNFKTIQYHQCYHYPLHDLFSVAHREKLMTKDLTCQIHLKSQKGLWKDKSWHSALHLVVASINLLATVCLIQVDRIKITLPKFLLWFSTKIIWLPLFVCIIVSQECTPYFVCVSSSCSAEILALLKHNFVPSSQWNQEPQRRIARICFARNGLWEEWEEE